MGGWGVRRTFGGVGGGVLGGVCRADTVGIAAGYLVGGRATVGGSGVLVLGTGVLCVVTLCVLALWVVTLCALALWVVTLCVSCAVG